MSGGGNSKEGSEKEGRSQSEEGNNERKVRRRNQRYIFRGAALTWRV